MVKNLPEMQEMQETLVQSLGWEDPLEKEMTTHSSILDWEIPWTEEPGRLQSMGLQRVRHDFHFFFHPALLPSSWGTLDNISASQVPHSKNGDDKYILYRVVRMMFKNFDKQCSQQNSHSPFK